MTTLVEAAVPAKNRHTRKRSAPVVVAVLHPKGGVGRSTTVWQLGAELALRGYSVRIEDLDQGAHLSRVFDAYPLGLDNLYLGGDAPADVVLLDTAPEAQERRALDYLRRSDWVLVPVKGPEIDSVQALPMLMGWITQVPGVRLIGFLPTMHKQRRASSKYWLGQLKRLAAEHGTRVLPPINDMASIADKSIAGHPYAGVAEEVRGLCLEPVRRSRT
ncbi:MAG: ParA family protein [Chloroflexi bacterium]|nr:ParA family protein [Chloroflexota bacterium]MBV9131264.1 ParA family protein [Chloroflexota bacterium]MBV9898708.1 ParA family protein [Chloroflexota bacterium]